jgi:predicted Fe-S protein YdhL (DUF1289 family)
MSIMPETKIDISNVQFSSTVFPTDEDMKLWHSLSPEEQRAVIRRALDEGEASGTAAPESMEEMMQRVRAEAAHDL